jgi:hypothetical protein
MRGRDLALFTVAASLIVLPALAFAQQPSAPWPAPPAAQSAPAAWPDPPATDQSAPPPKKSKKTAAKKKNPPDPPDPRFEEEPNLQPPDGPPPPPPDGGPPPAPRKRAAAPVLDIKCDGPFAKNTTFANLVKTFGVRNVFAQPGGPTVLFQSDPKRRVEVTWRDVVARARPAMILVEAQSTWRVRGFRLGDPMAQVEKVNGKPFTFVGFGGTPGGNARDWQGGKLDKLSGGCQLGMRFAAGSGIPADVASKLSGGGDLMSDSADVRAAKPVIIEMIVGYPE